MSTKSKTISRAARKVIVDSALAGNSPYRIAQELNEGRFRPPKSDRWHVTTVRNIVINEGLYLPRPNPKTSPEAEAMIVRFAAEGASIPETIVALDKAGLNPALGGDWRDVTVRRIRERHGNSTLAATDDERFAAAVETDPATGCEIWTGSLSDGYPKFETNGRLVLAHRWNYQREHGPIAEGVQLHHACRRPACVRVGHLVPTPATAHRTLEEEENRINEAAQSGELWAELEQLTNGDAPEWPEGLRVGSRRPETTWA